MGRITLTINGSEIVAEEGLTILEVAKRADIHIPTLCHLKGKPTKNPCTICVVEVEGQKELMRSCVMLARDGMVIQTESEKVVAHRQERLATLAQTHYGDCKAPCNLTCPGEINVQAYIAHINKGQYEEALRVVMERNPLPFSVGRVCPRFCETKCRRIVLDEPVAINNLKRFVADWCMAEGVDLQIPVADDSGKRVAVIGGGPAGLAAAYFLRRKGHQVTIFEAAAKLGGALRYGFSELSIPKNVLDYEIKSILKLGVETRLNSRWGEDFTIKSLRNDGYDAVFIASGAGLDKSVNIKGADSNYLYSGRNFLSKVADGKCPDMGRRVAVIGGNDIAIEIARIMLREGCEQVMVLFPRAREEMSAQNINIEEAEREGVKILTMVTPLALKDAQDGNHRLQLEIGNMQLGEADEKGRRHPELIPGSSVVLPLDSVVSSMWQKAVDDDLFAGGEEEKNIKISAKHTIAASPRNYQTSVAGVFAGGDAVSGPRSVIQAVVSARRAVDNIHAYLMGVEKQAPESRFNFTRGKLVTSVSVAEFTGERIRFREKMPTLPFSERQNSHAEVRLGYTEDMARREASRCLSCGCTAFDRCDLKRLSIDYKINLNKTGMATEPVYKKDFSHPLIVVDRNKCVFCNRCERSCEYDALELKTEGFDDKGRPLGLEINFNANCTYCGACVDNCSTGALNKKAQIVPVQTEEIKEIRSTCPYCGAGCQTVLRVKGNTILEVTGAENVPPNYGALCTKGRFGHEFVQDKSRLKTPLVRKDGELVPVSWDEALDYTAKRFNEIKKEYGPDAIAGFSCARASNEENYLMQKFMRTTIGTNNIDHCARL